VDLINKKPTFNGGPAESIPNLNPETAHRLDPLAERFAFIPLSGKIPLIKGWPKSKGYNIQDLLNYKNCTTIGARTGLFTGALLCFDLDGESSWYWLKSWGCFFQRLGSLQDPMMCGEGKYCSSQTINKSINLLKESSLIPKRLLFEFKEIKT